jgi:hypothetical protein
MKPEINTETAETVQTGGSQAVAQERLVSGSFTPGPWKADGYHVRQSGKRGTRMIADVCYTGPHHTPPDEYPKSCRLADEANARLIAAAPEMLEALERIRDYQGRFGEDDPQGVAADLLAKISSANAPSHAPHP